MLRKAARGFTLIELMIVVAIIGILASIAIPNFLRYQLRAKSGEAAINLGGIKTNEVAYFGSHEAYIDADANPTMSTTGSRAPFDKTAGNWPDLGWQPEGEVYFEYAVLKTDAAAAVPASFTAQARADLDVADETQCWLYMNATIAADGSVTASTTTGVSADCATTDKYNSVFKSSADGVY